MKNYPVYFDKLQGGLENTLTLIENSNDNIAQGYRSFRELKSLRNERREKNDELQMLYMLADRFDCDAMAEAYREVVEAMGRKEDGDVDAVTMKLQIERKM